MRGSLKYDAYKAIHTHRGQTQIHHKHTVTAISRKELVTLFNNLFTRYQARLSTEQVTASTIHKM